MNLETVEKNGQKFVLVPIEQYNQVLEEPDLPAPHFHTEN